MEKTKRKIEAVFPNIEVELLPRESRGDQLQNIPLQTVEGSDFFTQDIFDALQNGQADIAVHSLKDMSGSHFFGDNKFAIVERDDVRDVAIFNSSVEEKIKQGQTIIIGTCSPRREAMAIGFLKKALPQWNNDFTIRTKMIRGNVDSRLRKLDAGEYDGIILATAGINRLLESECQPGPVEGNLIFGSSHFDELSVTKNLFKKNSQPELVEDGLIIKNLLTNKKLMLLPLIECVPAPCQGAIVAEARYSNAQAVKVIEAINNKNLMQQCIQEKKAALQYGTGCLQKFGVTTIQYDGDKTVLYAAGTNEKDESFTNWQGLPTINKDESLFSSSDYMSNFFSYNYSNESISISQQHVYVANYKAIRNQDLIQQLQNKTVWAAGSKTWFQLAKQNIWVTGSADAFGLEFLEQAWTMPLIQINKNELAIITSKEGAATWSTKGWNTYATYELLFKDDVTVKEKISKANTILWTSFQQYQQYKSVVKSSAVHCCPSGETAYLLREAGLQPIVFPNIKSFLQWKQ